MVTVDASAAGEGELTVNITHNGVVVPAQITRDPHRPGAHLVNFTPAGSGIYTIRVHFAGIEVTGLDSTSWIKLSENWISVWNKGTRRHALHNYCVIFLRSVLRLGNPAEIYFRKKHTYRQDIILLQVVLVGTLNYKFVSLNFHVYK